MNSQRETTNSKSYFVLKNRFEIFFKDFWYTNINLAQICITNSIKRLKRSKIPYKQTRIFNFLIIINLFAKPNLSQKYILCMIYIFYTHDNKATFNQKLLNKFRTNNKVLIRGVQ